MLFNSLEFILFFGVVYGLYRLLGRHYRLQNAMLLVASYVFYGWWDYRFLFLIVLSTAIDYSTAIVIDRGTMSLGQRLRASALLLASAVCFVFIPWESVLAGRGLATTGGLTRDERLLALGGTAALVAVAWMLYPFVTRMEEGRRKKFALGVSMVANLVILGFFKYFNFFAGSFQAAWGQLFGGAPDLFTLNIILPVGISFYTFQTMSYTIDVYRKDLAASQDLTEFATFVAFFPQLVAGPIERASNLLPQFWGPRPAVGREQVRQAVWLIVWGLYKKMVVADNLAMLVNATFAPFDAGGTLVPPRDGLRLLIALYAFALQIYGDFSGYTDVARGTAKLLGFDIMLNFRLPYFATSPSSFWQRWHISLSSWLRDYLYIPLGGNRGSPFLTYRNLFLTMLLGGLWHGAAWTFVLWGAYHGALLILYRLAGIRTEAKAYPRWVTALLWLLMLHLTMIGWLIFRSQNIATIGVFLRSIALSPQGSPEAMAAFLTFLYYGGFLIAFQVVQEATGTLDPMPRMPWFLRLNVWVFLIMSLLVLPPRTPQQFIYFAF